MASRGAAAAAGVLAGLRQTASWSRQAAAVRPWRGTCWQCAHLSTSTAATPRDGGHGGASAQHADPLRELEGRGLVQHCTSRALHQHLSEPATTPRTVYLGIDPSAPSLHLGNLLPLFALFHLAHAGHRCIALVGGATGSIGDPSGRATERSALARAELEHNLDNIVEQLCNFFCSAGAWAAKHLPPAPPSQPGHRDEQSEWQDVQALLKRKETLAAVKVGQGAVFVLNNRAFYEDMNILDFLGDVGRHVRIGDMLARDSVKRRIHPTPEQPDPPGLSFTEFSYQLLQAYDFSLLHRSPWNCTVQIGGSDQLGNIMAGIDLIRRQEQRSKSSSTVASSDDRPDSSSAPAPAYGLTVPLLTTSTGAKFGKSAGNAIWLEPSLTSDLDLYQYFLKSVTDVDAPSLLNKLTLLPAQERGVEAATQGKGQPRAAQTVLATHLTSLLRGPEALQRAELASRILFGPPSTSASSSASSTSNTLANLTRAEIEKAFTGLPLLKRAARADVLGKEVWKVVADVGLLPSRAEGRRTLLNGGLYLNSVVLGKGETARVVGEEDVLGTLGQAGAPGFFVVRSGKSAHAIVLVD